MVLRPAEAIGRCRNRLADDARAACAAAWAHPRVVLAYCLYIAWVQSVLFGQLVNESMQGAPLLVTLIVPTALIGIASLSIALIFRRTRNPLEGLGIRVFACASMCVGTLFRLFLSLEPAQGRSSGIFWLVYCFGWLLVALGMSLFRIEMDRMLGWLGATKALYVVMAGSVVLGPVLACYILLPGVAAHALAIALPLAASLLLNHEVRSLPKRRYFSTDPQLPLPIPVQFTTTSFVQGVVSGVFYAGLAMSGYTGTSQSATFQPAMAAVSFILGSVLVLVVCGMARFNFNKLIYKVGFPMLAASLGILAVCSGRGEVGEMLYRIAAVFTDLVLWSLGAYIIKDMGMPACWIASLPGGALFLGTSMGALAFLAAWRLMPDGVLALVEMPLLAACLLLAASLFLPSERNMRSGWGTFRIGSDVDPYGDLDAAVALLAGENGLTARESDVVGAFARRMTRKEVAEALCVGDETVKTHLRGIYRKTGAHSQGELVSLVEKTRISMRGME